MPRLSFFQSVNRGVERDSQGQACTVPEGSLEASLSDQIGGCLSLLCAEGYRLVNRASGIVQGLVGVSTLG